jgi:hypothetical protein
VSADRYRLLGVVSANAGDTPFAFSARTGTVKAQSARPWIDHNDLAQGFDGLIDIKRGSS